MNDKWDKRYLKLAKEVASWSKDPSRQIGALIIGKKGQIISQGYNGLPRGIKDTEERLNDRTTKYRYVVHAEKNAIYNAIHNNSDIRNSILYVTGLPVCHECAKAVIQVGISRVVMDVLPTENWKDSGELAIEMFEEAGIPYKFYIDIMEN